LRKEFKRPFSRTSMHIEDLFFIRVALVGRIERQSPRRAHAPAGRRRPGVSRDHRGTTLV